MAGGYLDIGILDTMKDLLVNLIGAVVFSIIGYTTLKTSKKSNLSKQFWQTLLPNYTPHRAYYPELSILHKTYAYFVGFSLKTVK